MGSRLHDARITVASLVAALKDVRDYESVAAVMHWLEDSGPLIRDAVRDRLADLYKAEQQAELIEADGKPYCRICDGTRIAPNEMGHLEPCPRCGEGF